MKSKPLCTHWNSHETPRNLLERKESVCLHKDLRTWMFMVALFITAPSWEQVKFFLLLQKRMNYWYTLQPGWILKCFAMWKKPGHLLFRHSVVSDSLRPHGLQYARLPCPPLSPGVCSNSCPLSQWCHQTISSSVVPFSSCLQSFPASRSLHQVAKVLVFQLQHQNIHQEYSGLISFRMDWFDLLAVQGTLKSLLHSTVQKHQFFGAQFSLWSNFHMTIEKP